LKFVWPRTMSPSKHHRGTAMAKAKRAALYVRVSNRVESALQKATPALSGTLTAPEKAA
jgi:hypothetical protein